MRYAVRNLIRLKGKSILTFIIAFLILFLSMFGILITRLCEDSRANFWGALDGSVHVTDETLAPFFTYRTAEHITKHSDVIEKMSAYTEYSAHFADIEHIGIGRENFMRSPDKAERKYYEKTVRQIDYRKGFTLCAVTSMEIVDEVFSGDLTMVEGNMLNEKDNDKRAKKIVISKKNCRTIIDIFKRNCHSR